MTEELPFSKAAQLGRTTYCDETGQWLAKRVCKGPRCRGARNRRAGKRKQAAARRAARLQPPAWAGAAANEETLRNAVRIEVKSGRQVQRVATLYLEAEAQSEAAKAIGDPRPFMFLVMPHGWGSEGLAVVRLSKLADVVGALLEEWKEEG